MGLGRSRERIDIAWYGLGTGKRIYFVGFAVVPVPPVPKGSYYRII
jgi:hypothetical protein